MADSGVIKHFGFNKSRRIRKSSEFDSVYASRVVCNAGPLRVYSAPNDLGHCRLGLSVSKKAGNAVTRNRIKRMLREAFRLLQNDLPGEYDLVVTVHRHDGLTLDQYQKFFADAAAKLNVKWVGRKSE